MQDTADISSQTRSLHACISMQNLWQGYNKSRMSGGVSYSNFVWSTLSVQLLKSFAWCQRGYISQGMGIYLHISKLPSQQNVVKYDNLLASQTQFVIDIIDIDSTDVIGRGSECLRCRLSQWERVPGDLHCSERDRKYSTPSDNKNKSKRQSQCTYTCPGPPPGDLTVWWQRNDRMG